MDRKEIIEEIADLEAQQNDLDAQVDLADMIDLDEAILQLQDMLV